MRKVNKTKVEKLPDGKVKISKENNAALASLVGKKPENLSGADLGAFLNAVAVELGWVDDKGDTAYKTAKSSAPRTGA